MDSVLQGVNPLLGIGVSILTPLITGVIKKLANLFLSENNIPNFKKVTPLVPVLTGVGLVMVGNSLGMDISPQDAELAVGSLWGMVGSKGYDVIKAPIVHRKKK